MFAFGENMSSLLPQSALRSLVCPSATVNMFKKKNNKTPTHSHLTSQSTSNLPTDGIKQQKSLFRFFLTRNKRTLKVAVHPIAITHLEDAAVDDDAFSLCSEGDGDIFLDQRISSSVPNLAVTSWDSPRILPTGMLGYKHRSLQTETVNEEDEGDEEEDSGPSTPQQDEIFESTEPAVKYPSAPIPIVVGRRHHNRSLSLPQAQELPKSLYHRQLTPSESWDDDFDLGTNDEVLVPSTVEQNQVLIRMDMSNIRDFNSQIDDLKNLRDKKLKLAANVKSKLKKNWTSGIISRKNMKKFKNLEKMYHADWEEANVIIDLSDVDQDRQPPFLGERNVELGTERVQSERHLDILRKIIDDSRSNEDETVFNIELDEENKENSMAATTLTTPNAMENEQLENQRNGRKFINGWPFHGLKRNISGVAVNNHHETKKKRRGNVRISTDEVPGLIDHLQKLRNHLLIHINYLENMDVCL